MKIRIKHEKVLFWLGLAGILFYVIGPIIFPHLQGIRQPELLPVYTLMMGLGQLLNGEAIITIAKPEDKKEEDEENGTHSQKHR